MEHKIKIGVFGAGRGSTMMNYCKAAKNAVLVAICDKRKDALEQKKKEFEGHDIAYFTDFDEFLKHDIDAVVLANYATEHAPFAVKAMEAGKHVLSEVLPVQTMAQAVELIECVEKTGMVYSYAENYCYMPAPYEMRRLYREGKIGKFEYGEGEYMHNCESIWRGITENNNPTHWRNTMYSTYYCTHSIGPLIHITGLRPIKVVGFEVPYSERMDRMGAFAGPIGMEIITLENGALLKSIHGVGPSRDSIWYSIYGGTGRLESAREDAENGGTSLLYANGDSFEGGVNKYNPQHKLAAEAEGSGHGNSDFFTMYNFVEKINGNADADIIDIYEALDMFLPGLFGYRSILNGNIPMEIPNLRDKAVRELYRNDKACVDPNVAGDMVIPSSPDNCPFISKEAYEKYADIWK